MASGSKLCRVVRVSMAAAVIAMSVGCGKVSLSQEAEQPMRQSENETKPFEISEIRVNESESGTPRQTTPEEPVVVSIKTSGAPGKENLEVKLFDLGAGAVVASEKRSLKADSGDEHVFTLKGEKPWASGRYLVEVTVGGKLAGHRELDVMESGPVSQ